MAKLDVYLWLGLSKHIKYCLNGLPQGFDIDFGEQDVEQIHCIPRVLTYYGNTLNKSFLLIFHSMVLLTNSCTSLSNAIQT